MTPRSCHVTDASTDTTQRSCHVMDDSGRRRHGDAWGPTRRRCVSQRHRPNLGAMGLHAEILAPSGARPRRPNNASWPNSSARCHLTPSHQTSARPDSTPRSGPLKPRRGPLLLPPSILKAPALTSSPPHGPHETLAPKCDPRCPDLVSRSFLEVMVPLLL